MCDVIRLENRFRDVQSVGDLRHLVGRHKVVWKSEAYKAHECGTNCLCGVNIPATMWAAGYFVFFDGVDYICRTKDRVRL